MSKHLARITTIILKERIFESEHFVLKLFTIIFSGISTAYLASIFIIDHLKNNNVFKIVDISISAFGRIVYNHSKRIKLP